MKMLVTGGAGYLGSEVCRLAVAAGHDVIALRLHAEPPHGRAVRLDLRDDDDVQRSFMKHGPELVVHTAYRQAEEALAGDVVRATRNVALAAHRVGARLVHVSTDLVFDGEKGSPYTEDDEPRPVSPYGQAKLHAEELVGELHPAAVVVRTSLLYGKPEPGPQERLALSDATFYVDEIRCPTHVGDLAAALLELGAGEPPAGALHVAGPQAVSRYELARLLRAALGRDPEDARGVPSPRVGRARDV
ncbi:MAG TPA: sugar nucleotide-binding protein, partial [Gaiellaceae bacterium]|nr:sugar nucleotide-binding protein [Gaiellaceae bacterium]